MALFDALERIPKEVDRVMRKQVNEMAKDCAHEIGQKLKDIDPRLEAMLKSLSAQAAFDEIFEREVRPLLVDAGAGVARQITHVRSALAKSFEAAPVSADARADETRRAILHGYQMAADLVIRPECAVDLLTRAIRSGAFERHEFPRMLEDRLRVLTNTEEGRRVLEEFVAATGGKDARAAAASVRGYVEALAKKAAAEKASGRPSGADAKSPPGDRSGDAMVADDEVNGLARATKRVTLDDLVDASRNAKLLPEEAELSKASHALRTRIDAVRAARLTPLREKVMPALCGIGRDMDLSLAFRAAIDDGAALATNGWPVLPPRVLDALVADFIERAERSPQADLAGLGWQLIEDFHVATFKVMGELLECHDPRSGALQLTYLRPMAHDMIAPLTRTQEGRAALLDYVRALRGPVTRLELHADGAMGIDDEALAADIVAHRPDDKAALKPAEAAAKS